MRARDFQVATVSSHLSGPSRLVMTFDCCLERRVASDEGSVVSEPGRVHHDRIDAWAQLGIYLKHVADQSHDVLRSLRIGTFLEI